MLDLDLRDPRSGYAMSKNDWGPVSIYPHYHGGENERWKVVGKEIVSDYKNLRLDVQFGNDHNGTLVGCTKKTGLINQQWKLPMPPSAAMELLDDGVTIPIEYEDAIMNDLMNDPVLLPKSKQIVDRSTIQRLLLKDATDPFTRTPLTMAMVQPMEALRKDISTWKNMNMKNKQ